MLILNADDAATATIDFQNARWRIFGAAYLFPYNSMANKLYVY